MALDGTVADLADPIERDAKIEFLNRDDPRALELIRHDAAHVLAEAVQSLWPGTQVTIGPVIENGFYYDFRATSRSRRKTSPSSKRRCRRSSRATNLSPRKSGRASRPRKSSATRARTFKVELIDAIPADQSLKIYKQGDWFDLCRGPHMTSTGKVGNAFKLMKVAGAYWRGDSKNPMLTRIYGTAFAKQEELDAYLKQIEEAEKRDHRRLGREMDLFHFQEEAPARCSGTRKAGRCSSRSRTTSAAGRWSSAYAEVNAPQLMDSSLWVASGHMATFRESMFLTAAARG